MPGCKLVAGQSIEVKTGTVPIFVSGTVPIFVTGTVPIFVAGTVPIFVSAKMGLSPLPGDIACCESPFTVLTASTVPFARGYRHKYAVDTKFRTAPVAGKKWDCPFTASE
jgi:hypothetical protein